MIWNLELAYSQARHLPETGYVAFLSSWYWIILAIPFFLIIYPYNYFICASAYERAPSSSSHANHGLAPRHTSNRRCILHGSHRTGRIGNTVVPTEQSQGGKREYPPTNSHADFARYRQWSDAKFPV